MKFLSYDIEDNLIRLQTNSAVLPEFVFFKDQYPDVATLKEAIEKTIAVVEEKTATAEQNLTKLKKELDEECQKQT